MGKLEEAQEILKTLGLPPAQQNEISAYTLLAMAGIAEDTLWEDATKNSKRVTKGIMQFISDTYQKEYAPNTRETVRRQVLHQFVQARLVDLNPDIPDLPVNSPRTHYAITDEALEAIKTYGTDAWASASKAFVNSVGSLKARYAKERAGDLIPVTLSDGTELKLSPGRHNEVQKAIVEDFAPRFAKESKVLYIGDTAKKDLYIDTESLGALGIPIDQHSKLPDVVIYDEGKQWLYLIEAVTSHGPVSPKRVVELEALLSQCKVGKVYVTAFPDFAEFKKHSKEIAWETEVWIMDIPDHMIHFNGDRFMGPR
ncbi:BsuBI/PstI family type II restriction endonuclease [Echinicola sp. 20G]|uniref:BsuBI/PstI family type II restriction endonuclease n=1 Tax=Echinicola sp. 20G TaxID=2781961 RepID=UPI00191109C9|nr:BsuBI/PstI family type II restriction endonuclease [Echinicola sp. 20G]